MARTLEALRQHRGGATRGGDERCPPVFPMIFTGQRTTAWNETSPDAPGAITPGRSHFSSLEPTRFSAVEKLVPLGPLADPRTYSRRGKRLSVIEPERMGVFPILR